jgi:purine-binding chemotaxis protein CheW
MSIAAIQPDATSLADPRAGKYLTFQLDREEFGIGVMQVREIMGLQDITVVPQTPGHVRGVINLRGKVVPVLCLRSKFGLPRTEDTPRTCIIVVQVEGEAGPIQIGVIVDSVLEVLNVCAAELEDTPDFGTGQSTAYLLGMAKVKNTVKILLNINAVIGTAGLGRLSLS